MNPLRSILFVCVVMALVSMACGLPAGAEGPKEVTVVVVVTQTPAPVSPDNPAANPTATGSNLLATPTATVENITSEPTATVENTAVPTKDNTPQCSILKNVNLRKGPGTVFDPPINLIKKGEVVSPEGFAPQGFPDGVWIFVTRTETGEKGWISADASLVDCNIEISGLPVVAAPPTPAVLRVRSSKPDGTPNGIDGTVITDPKILLQFKAIGPGGSNDGDHIKEVTFQITDSSGNTVYEHAEQSVPYCAFGGDNRCDPWPKYNGHYTWGNNGSVVQSGEYQANITATTDDETGNAVGNWFFTIQVNVP